MGDISPAEINGQAWKYCLAPFAWLLFLFLIPAAYAAWGSWAFVPIVLPGLYLFSWMGYLMHEAWHGFVPAIPNRLVYRVFAYLLLTDPQVYHLLHGHHHSEVNTYDDRELHPFGRIQSVGWRRLYHVLEIGLGMGFVLLMCLVVVSRHPRYAAKYRAGDSLLTLVVLSGFLSGLGWLTHLFWGASLQQVAFSWGMTYLLGSMLLHHTQLIEHGNLIVAGDRKARNVRTRNLRRSTLLERLFHWVTHHDAQEHVLHHTQTRVYSRPFPGRIPLPEGAVIISFADYLGILADMLGGRDSVR